MKQLNKYIENIIRSIHNPVTLKPWQQRVFDSTRKDVFATIEPGYGKTFLAVFTALNSTHENVIVFTPYRTKYMVDMLVLNGAKRKGVATLKYKGKIIQVVVPSSQQLPKDTYMGLRTVCMYDDCFDYIENPEEDNFLQKFDYLNPVNTLFLQRPLQKFNKEKQDEI